MDSFQSKNKIRVVWFAASFIGRSASGTAQTARKIIINLIKNHSDKIEVILLTKNQLEIDLIRKEEVFKGTEIVKLPNVFGSWLKSSRQFYKFCLLNRDTKFDILHYSVPRVYPFFWLFPAKKIVCTFHAGGDVTVPRDFFTASREIYNFIIKKQWQKFGAIVADSEFAKREIAIAYKIPETYIKIIYLGADNLWGLQDHEFEKDLNLVLVMGRWQLYKNLHTVVSAFKKFEIPTNPNLKLRIIGKSGSLAHEIKAEALNNFPENQIELVEYLGDSELANQYRLASVVFHPSINEGFGLPAFEAFGEGARIVVHSGTPADEILSSQSGVVAEDLLDEEKIINSYRSIKAQSFGDIRERRIFIESVSATWSQASKKYLQLYKEVLNT
jgi:glycosyltransferase involved in cell wall biosynthesis